MTCLIINTTLYENNEIKQKDGKREAHYCTWKNTKKRKKTRKERFEVKRETDRRFAYYNSIEEKWIKSSMINYKQNLKIYKTCRKGCKSCKGAASEPPSGDVLLHYL